MQSVEQIYVQSQVLSSAYFPTAFCTWLTLVFPLSPVYTSILIYHRCLPQHGYYRY